MNMTFLQEMFNSITQRDALLRRKHPETLTPDHHQLVKACQALLASDGEASSIALASRALAIYQRLSEGEKRQFFKRLADDFAYFFAQAVQLLRAQQKITDGGNHQHLRRAHT